MTDPSNESGANDQPEDGYQWTEQDVDSEYRYIRAGAVVGSICVGAAAMNINPILGALAGTGSYLGSKFFLDRKANELKAKIRNEVNQETEGKEQPEI